MRFNTGNPVEPNGSSDPRDLYDNAGNFDLAVNGAAEQWTDRLGVSRKSWAGMESEFNADQAQRETDFQNFLLTSGYQDIGDYDADGPLNITARNQVFTKNGEYWRAASSLVLPYTTVNNWVTDQPKFVSVGDAVLRQDLENPDGAGLIGWERTPISEAVSTVSAALSAAHVNIWEYADLATGYAPGGDPATWDWAPAIQAAVNLGLPIVFPAGTFNFGTTISFTKANSFFGYGIRRTILKYTGTAGTFGFVHAFTGDGSDQWPGRVQWENMTIRGDGTTNFGANATVSGIQCADDSANLINIPWYSVRRVQFEGLVTGIELEGYAHIFEDCWAEKCAIGYDLVHPEQGAMHDCWANYCDIGLAINKRKQKFGHHFIISGGAYQRCNVGIDAWNVDELDVNTYFEINNVADLRCGDPTDAGNYTKGCKNVRFWVNSTGLTDPDAVACLQFYATVGIQGHFFSTVNAAGRYQPNVLANGFSKYIEIQYNRERVYSTNPWVFAGEAVRRSIARPMGSHEELRALTLNASWADAVGRETRFYKLNMETVRLTGAPLFSSGSSTIGTLPDGHRPANTETFSVPRYDNAGAAWLTPAVIEIQTSGNIVFSNVGNNQRVFLDGITFRTSSA